MNLAAIICAAYAVLLVSSKWAEKNVYHMNFSGNTVASRVVFEILVYI